MNRKRAFSCKLRTGDNVTLKFVMASKAFSSTLREDARKPFPNPTKVEAE